MARERERKRRRRRRTRDEDGGGGGERERGEEGGGEDEVENGGEGGQDVEEMKWQKFSTEGLGREEAELVKYLEEAYAALQAERDDVDAGMALATAAVREVTPALVASPSGSRAVEAILETEGVPGDAAAAALVEKLAAADGGLVRAACAPCGSFVLQRAFARAPQVASVALRQIMPELATAASHRSASHALRSLVDAIGANSARGGSGGGGGGGDDDDPILLICDLAAAGASAAQSIIGGGRMNSYGVGFYTVLLRKLAGSTSGGADADAPPTSTDSAVSDAMNELVEELLKRGGGLARLAKDVAGSHLSQCIVECACSNAHMKKRIFDHMFASELRGRLNELSTHKRAMFTVRSMLFAAETIGARVVEDVLDELNAHLGDLMCAGNGAIVNALILACATLGAGTKKAARALRKCILTMPDGGVSDGIDAGSSGHRNGDTRTECRGEEDADDEEEGGGGGGGKRSKYAQLAPRILQLDGLLGGRPSGPATRAGCGLLVTVLKFPAKNARAFRESIGALNAEAVRELAWDSAGCRVLEAYIESEGASEENKSALVRQLDGEFAGLAMENHGSFLIGRAFKHVDTELKERIAQALSVARRDIGRTNRGPSLLHQCGIVEYERDPRAWRSSLQKTAKMVGEFRDMFDDVHHQNHSHGGGDGNGRKKKRRKRSRAGDG